MTQKENITRPIHVELLYFDGCPSYKTTWAELLEVITEADLDVSVRPIKINSLERAHIYSFAGSPTVKVNGRDLEHFQGQGVMACRVYEENGGKGYPSKALLRRRLREEAS